MTAGTKNVPVKDIEEVHKVMSIIDELSVVSEMELEDYTNATNVMEKYIFWFDTEEEMKSQKRFIWFSDRDEAKDLFDALSIYEQKIVINTILQFTEEAESFGHNLYQLVLGVKDAVSIKGGKNVPTDGIIALLMNARGEFDSSAPEFDPKDHTSLKDTNVAFYELVRKANIDATNRNNLNKAIELLCVYMGFSLDVLFNGKGECYILKKEISEEKKDTETFANTFWDKLSDAWYEETYSSNSMRDVNVKEIYKRAGIDFEIKYVTLKYSGCYQYLKHNKSLKKKALNIVNQLIYNLANRPDLSPEETSDIEENDPYAEAAFQIFLEKHGYRENK